MYAHDELAQLLTDREWDVLRGIGLGWSNAEIAQQLVLSSQTVKWYTRQIYNKLQLMDVPDKREAAARVARAAGMVGNGVRKAAVAADITPFFGREQEIDHLQRLLHEGNHRLVVIVGIGGVGKTRLAQHVAHLCVPDFAGRVYIIRLQAIHSANEMFSAMGQALCVPGNQAPLDPRKLAVHLGNDPALIVLDNFEHLTELAPMLVDCLQRSPRLTILVTSRQLLGLSSETVLTLGGLPYPDLDAETEISPEEYAAVAYFISVVKQGNARWQPTTENLSQIAQICKVLDGHPLALNLSARWALIESVSGVAEQLRLGNALLVTDASDIPPCQRNIDAILSTTIHYLEPAEKLVYPRLGVVEGEFSLEALLAIANTSRVTVRSLIYHGIMEITEPGYFRLHPLISRHALQELQKTSEEATVQERFREYYTTIACELAPDLRSNLGNQKRFAREWHHIRAVWKRALEHDDFERLNLLQRPLHFFAWHSSNLDALALLEAVLEVPLLSQVDPVLCANVHICRLQLRINSEPLELLIEEGREAVAVLEDKSPGVDLAFGLYMLSMVYRENGQWQPAYDCASRALLICEELGERWGSIIGKYQLGLLCSMAGNHQKALKYWQVATKLAHQMNEFAILATIQHRMGQLLWQQGKQEEAIPLLEDLIRTEEILISAESYGGLAQLLSMIHFSMGQFVEAGYYRRNSIDYYQKVGDANTVAYLLTQEAYECLLREEITEAQNHLTKIYAIALPYQHDIVATVADHVAWMTRQTYPSTAQLKERIQRLSDMNSPLQAVLTATLMLPTLSSSHPPETAHSFAAALISAPEAPRWLSQLPIMKAFFHHTTGLEEATFHEIEREQCSHWTVQLRQLVENL